MKRIDLLTPALLVIFSTNVVLAAGNQTQSPKAAAPAYRPAPAPTVTYKPPPAPAVTYKPAPKPTPAPAVTYQTAPAAKPNFAATGGGGYAGQNMTVKPYVAPPAATPKAQDFSAKDTGAYGKQTTTVRPYVAPAVISSPQRVEREAQVPSVQPKPKDTVNYGQANAYNPGKTTYNGNEVRGGSVPQNLPPTLTPNDLNKLRKDQADQAAARQAADAQRERDLQNKIRQQQANQIKSNGDRPATQVKPQVFNSNDYVVRPSDHKNGDGKTLEYYDKATGKKVGSEVYRNGKLTETNVIGAGTNKRITADGKVTNYDKHDNRNFESKDPSTGVSVNSRVVMADRGVEKRIVETKDKDGRKLSRDVEYKYINKDFRGVPTKAYIPRERQVIVPVYVGPTFTEELYRTALIVSILRSNPGYQHVPSGPIIYDGQVISQENYSRVESDRSSQQKVEDYINNVNEAVVNTYKKDLGRVENPGTIAKGWRWAKKFVGMDVEDLDKTATVGPNHKIAIKGMVNRLLVALASKAQPSSDANAQPEQNTIGLDYIFNNDGTVRNKISMIVNTKTDAIYDIDQGQVARKPCKLAGGQIVEPQSLSKGADNQDDAIVKIVQSDSDIDEDDMYCQGGKTVRVVSTKYVPMMSRLLEVIDDAMDANK